jgi:hypothetical protein
MLKLQGSRGQFRAAEYQQRTGYSQLAEIVARSGANILKPERSLLTHRRILVSVRVDGALLGVPGLPSVVAFTK